MHLRGPSPFFPTRVILKVINMFIGFLSYTNEAVIGEVKEGDLSILDESVMDALDLKMMDPS